MSGGGGWAVGARLGSVGVRGRWQWRAEAEGPSGVGLGPTETHDNSGCGREVVQWEAEACQRSEAWGGEATAKEEIPYEECTAAFILGRAFWGQGWGQVIFSFAVAFELLKCRQGRSGEGRKAGSRGRAVGRQRTQGGAAPGPNFPLPPQPTVPAPCRTHASSPSPKPTSAAPPTPPPYPTLPPYPGLGSLQLAPRPADGCRGAGPQAGVAEGGCGHRTHRWAAALGARQEAAAQVGRVGGGVERTEAQQGSRWGDGALPA